MIDLASIIQEINQHLDGEALVRAFQYHPEKIQLNGPTIKCFCPVHNELAFRSLIVNLKPKTFKCTMKWCTAFGGGTLVELWALYRKIEPIEAAIELVELFKLPVDLASLRGLSASYAEKAQAELAQGNHEQARAAIDQALAFDPRNQDFRLFSARVWEAAGQAENALSERLQVFDTCLESEALAEARRLLDELLPIQPDCRPLLERAVALARAEGDAAALKRALVALGEHQVAGGETASALVDFEEASRLDPADTALLERLAHFNMESGRTENARELLARLAAQVEAVADGERLLAVLTRQAELDPGDLAIAEKIAAVLEQLGRREPARNQWLRLVEFHTIQGRLAEAERILARMLAADPNDVDLLQRQAEFYVRAGDSRRAVGIYRHLATLAQQVGENTEVGEFYERARRIDPQDLGLRRDQAEWRLKTGDLDGGLTDLFSLADLYLEHGEKDAGMAVLAHIATLAPADLDKRLRIGRCLERNSLEAEAYAAYCQLVRDFMRQQQPDAALAICEEVRRLRPGDLATLDLRVEIHIALKHKGEAIEVCRDFAREALAAGEVEAAESALQRGVRIDRTEIAARQDLARIYESTGRPGLAAELWVETALFCRGQEDFPRACVAAREALRLAPESREGRVILAESLEAQGQQAEALDLWECLAGEHLQDDPGSPDAYEMLRHALTLAPGRRPLLARVAQLALRLEGPGAARDDFRAWLESFDREPAPAAALEAYRLAVEAYPDVLEWRQQLVTLLQDLGEEHEAAGHLEVLLGIYRGRGAGETEILPLLEQLAIMQPERFDLRRDLAYLLASQGRDREAAHLFEELGNLALAQQGPAEALPLLERALDLRPELDDTLAVVARLYEGQGRAAEAVALYERLAELRRRQTTGPRCIEVIEKLLEYQPDRVDLRAELAELFALEGDTDRAIEQLFALAGTARAAGDTPGVIDLCLRIRSHAPEFTPARELLIESYLKDGQTGPAKRELDQLGDAALAAGRLEDAEAFFKRIQAIDPDDISAGERLGKLYEARHLLDEAVAAFQHVLDIYLRLAETARAIGVLRKLRQLRPDDLNLQIQLARMLLEAGDRRESSGQFLELFTRALETRQDELAAEALGEALKAFPQEWAWRISVVRTLAAAGRDELAAAQWLSLAGDALDARQYETAREAAGEGLVLAPEELRLRELRVDANCALHLDDAAIADLRDLAERAAYAGNFTRAEACLRRAIELQPRHEEALDELAEVLAAAGRIPEACTLQRRLIDILRQGGRLDQALRRARRLAELTPDDEDVHDFLATLLLEAGRRDEAIAAWREMADRCAAQGDTEVAIARYARLLDVLPGDVDLMRRLADLTYDAGGMLEAMGAYDRLIDALHASGDLTALEAEYRRILEMEPGHLQLKERFADFLHEQGRPAEARQAFIEIIAAYRDERSQLDDALRIMRHLKTLQPEDLIAREEEALLLENAGRAPEAAQAWRQIAVARRRAGEAEPCACALARAAELENDNAELQLEAARLSAMLGDRERAIHYFLRAIEIFDRHERLEACVPVLREAIQLDPGRLELPDALARIHERLGQNEEALVQWLALGESHERAGRPAVARQIYTHVRALLPEELQSRRRLAALCEAEGDRPGALRELRELAALAERELAFDEAAAYFQRLLALDPADEEAMLHLADVWRALGHADDLFTTLAALERHYSSSGREDEALAILAELKTLRPDEPELTGRAIDLLVRTGHTAEAARQGIELIQIYFDRGDDHHALETLRRIAEIEPGNIERRISLARLIHANRREPAALQEFYLNASKLFGESNWNGCLAVCEAGLALFPDEMRLRDLMGRVLSRMGRQTESIEVQLHMAALYDERGEDAKARRVYEIILDEQPEHQETLEAMVDWAMRHDRHAVAVEHLLRLAEIHYLAGRLKESIGAMERIQDLDPARLDVRARLAETCLEAGEEDRAFRTFLSTAAAMVEAGRYEAAIEIYERLLMLRPEAVEVMAALVPVYRAAGRTEAHEKMSARLGERYLAQGWTGEALELFEEMTRRYPQDLASWERLAELYAGLGRTGDAVEAHRAIYEIHRGQRRLDQARKALEAALELRPGDAEMLESLGDLCLSLSRRPEGLAWLARAAHARRDAAEHERARDLAQRILKLDPLNLDVRHLLAVELEALGQREAAMEEALAAAHGYAEAGQNEPAIAILCHLLTLDPQRVEERELYAKLLHREHCGAESVSQYLLLLGMVDQDDDPRRAIKYCRQILTEQPDHPEAHAHLCGIYERSEKLRPAYKECEWLADHFLAGQDFVSAERYIQKGLAWFPEDMAMRTRLIDLLIGLGRLSEAGQQLASLARMAEDRADTRLTEWAMARACAIEPDNLEHHLRLADYQDRTGNQAGARQTRLGLIRLLASSGRQSQAREMAARLVATAAEDHALRLELASLLEECGLTDAAASHFHQLARQALTLSEYEEAKGLARRAIALEPRLTAAAETLIAALAAKRELGEAIEEGERLFGLFEAAGDWDGALRAMQALVDLVPSRPEPRRRIIQLHRKLHREDAMIEQLRRIAEIYVNTGEVVGAIESLRELLDARPDDTMARSRYIDLYTQLGDEDALMDDYLQLARSCVRKGRLVEATRAYEKVIVLSPGDPACREEFVGFLFEQGQIHRGVDETRALADLYERLGNDKDAGRVLDRALNYSPQEIELRQRLAGVHLRTNRRGLALETYRGLARQYEHAGDDARLLEVIERIVEIDSINVEFRQRLADLLESQGRGEEAFAQFALLARQYEERGLFDLAEHEYRRMLAIHPDDPEALSRLTELHLRSGSPADLLPELKRLAAHYSAQGCMRESIRIYRMILDYEPDNTELLNEYLESYMQFGMEQDLVDDYLRMADLKAKKGDLAEAMRIYKRILEVQPGNKEATQRLSETQRLTRAGKKARNNGHDGKGNGNGARDLAATVVNPPSAALTADPPPRGAEPAAASLDKVIRNYENILMLAPNNPSVRVKLAETLEKAGNAERAGSEWILAAESYLSKGEITRGIEIYERCLSRRPADADLADRLARARLQLESLRVVDGALRNW